MYLTTKEGVYLQHHKVYAYGQEPIEVPDDILLMDLGDKNGLISMLRLYSDQLFTGEAPCDLKLTAYHMSYSQ